MPFTESAQSPQHGSNVSLPGGLTITTYITKLGGLVILYGRQFCDPLGPLANLAKQEFGILAIFPTAMREIANFQAKLRYCFLWHYFELPEWSVHVISDRIHAAFA
jgi:hypothetical protein